MSKKNHHIFIDGGIDPAYEKTPHVVIKLVMIVGNVPLKGDLILTVVTTTDSITIVASTTDVATITTTIIIEGYASVITLTLEKVSSSFIIIYKCQ